MSFIHNLRTTWDKGVGGSDTLAGAISRTGDAETNLEISVPASTPAFEVDLSIIESQLQLFFLVTDGPLSIKTNSSSSPDNTFNVINNSPLSWISGVGAAPLFSATVTKLYFGNATATPVKVSIRSLQDVTPA